MSINQVIKIQCQDGGVQTINKSLLEKYPDNLITLLAGIAKESFAEGIDQEIVYLNCPLWVLEHVLEFYNTGNVEVNFTKHKSLLVYVNYFSFYELQLYLNDS